MSQGLINVQNLSDIANAIRQKNGEQTLYKPSEMAQAILDIPQGGGGDTEEVQDYLYFTYPYSTKSSTSYIDISHILESGEYFDEFYSNDEYYLKINGMTNKQHFSYIKVDARNTNANIEFSGYNQGDTSSNVISFAYVSDSAPSSYPSFSTINSWEVGDENEYGTLIFKNINNTSDKSFNPSYQDEDKEFYIIFGYIMKTYNEFSYLYIQDIKIMLGENNYAIFIPYTPISDLINDLTLLQASGNKLNLVLNQTFSLKDLNNINNRNLILNNKDLFKNTINIYRLFKEESFSLNTYELSWLSSFLKELFKDDKTLRSLYYSFYLKNQPAGASLVNSYDYDFTFLNTQDVDNFSYMFYNWNFAKKLDLSNFDTKNVRDMSYMFYGCSQLQDLYVQSFNTENVETMRYMFNNCKFSQIYLKNFRTPNVSNMAYMFAYCSNLLGVDLSDFDFSKTTDMSSYFNGCSSLISVIFPSSDSNLFSNCSGFGSMFNGCSSLRSIAFNVGNITLSNTILGMSSMFSNCANLEEVLLTQSNSRNFDINCSSLFASCYKLQKIYLKIRNISSTSSKFNIFTTSSSVLYPDLTYIELGAGWAPNLSSISYLNTGALNKNVRIKFLGDFSSSVSTSTLYLNNFWNSADYVSNFETFVNDLPQLSGNYTRRIIIHSTLYNALSSSTIATLTSKNYTLVSS